MIKEVRNDKQKIEKDLITVKAKLQAKENEVKETESHIKFLENKNSKHDSDVMVVEPGTSKVPRNNDTSGN